MPALIVPFISGQFSGFKNEIVLTSDKHKVIYNGTLNEPGIVKTRPGNTQVNDLGSGDVLGLHDASFANGTHVQLATVGTKVYNVQTGAEFSSHAYTTAKKMEYVNFLNLVFVVNGQDAMSTLNSSGTYEGTTNVTNAPVANYIAKYGSRIWANDTSNPRRIHRSLPVSGGAITWDTTTEFFDIDSSGDRNTGIHIARNTLMAFTNDDVEIRYFTRARLGILRGVGTLSNRSIVTSAGTTFWYHNDDNSGYRGIYGYDGTGADTAQLLSTPIQDVFDAMSDANNDDVVGWVEGSSVVWYIGDVSLEYGTVNHVCLNLKNKGWSVWYMPYTVRAAHQFMNSTTMTRSSYIGETNGIVYQRTGVKDGTTDIESFIMPHAITGPDPFAYYQFSKVHILGQQFASTKLFFKSDIDEKWNEEGFEPSFQSNKIFEANAGTNGSSVDLKMGLNDQAGQSLKAYKLTYEVQSARS